MEKVEAIFWHKRQAQERNLFFFNGYGFVLFFPYFFS